VPVLSPPRELAQHPDLDRAADHATGHQPRFPPGLARLARRLLPVARGARRREPVHRRGPAAQFLGKTNQFDLATRRHSIGRLREFMPTPASRTSRSACRDRFADQRAGRGDDRRPRSTTSSTSAAASARARYCSVRAVSSSRKRCSSRSVGRAHPEAGSGGSGTTSTSGPLRGHDESADDRADRSRVCDVVQSRCSIHGVGPGPAAHAGDSERSSISYEPWNSPAARDQSLTNLH
jgi:hypothetical protein